MKLLRQAHLKAWDGVDDHIVDDLRLADLRQAPVMLDLVFVLNHRLHPELQRRVVLEYLILLIQVLLAQLREHRRPARHRHGSGPGRRKLTRPP